MKHPFLRMTLLALLASVGTVALVRAKPMSNPIGLETDPADRTHLNTKVRAMVWAGHGGLIPAGVHEVPILADTNLGPEITPPEGYAFVVTDIFADSSGGGKASGILACTTYTSGPFRLLSFTIEGDETTHFPLSGGLVVPSGQTLMAGNSLSSSASISIRAIGYFVRGDALEVHELPY